MSLFITVTRCPADGIGKVAFADQHVFDASSAQEAAEMHRAVTGAEEALVFPVELGKRFRKASMVEVPTLAKERAKERALDLQYASQLAACKDPFVR